MIRVTPATQPQYTSLHPAQKQPCTHSRLIEDVLSAEGARTGQLLCLECNAVFPDPAHQNPAH